MLNEDELRDATLLVFANKQVIWCFIKETKKEVQNRGFASQLCYVVLL